ncbi:hypothetical protein HGRIS_006598 [Hohenbuehelia grisea]
MTCNKRLDSRTLLEHNQEPYCKTCHVKNFGTRDLRQANLPHRTSTELPGNSVPPPLPPSPMKKAFTQPSGVVSDSLNGSFDYAPPLPFRSSSTPGRGDVTKPSVASSVNGANGHAVSAGSLTEASVPSGQAGVSSISSPGLSFESAEVEADVEATEALDTVPTNVMRAPPIPPRSSGMAASHTGSFPSPAIPLTPTRTGFFAERRMHYSSNSVDTSFVSPGPGTPSRVTANLTGIRPLVPSATGTRYGSALGGTPGSMSPVRKWNTGTSNPMCPRCSKTVYFAEQVKAIGKTYHKGCLRCSQCSTLLDSTRLTEKEGQPFCHRCYSKVHGPQGSGYALLGKAGG